MLLWLLHRADGNFVEYIGMATAPRNGAAESKKADRITLVDDWESQVLENEVQIFPPLPVMPGSLVMNEELRAGLASCQEKPLKRAKTEASVRFLNNADGESDTDSEESQEGEGLPAAVLACLAGQEGVEEGVEDDHDDVPQPAEERQRRVHRWGAGRWTLSEVWKENVQIGWWANCNRHFDSTGRACRKMITFVNDSPDQCRCLAKQWLLMGAKIKCGDPAGRRKHVRDIKREDIVLRDEAELDAMAAALH